MFGLGPLEIVLVLAIILLLGGASQIPKVFRALGQAKGEFERGTTEGQVSAERAGGRSGKARAEDEQVSVDRAELEELRRLRAERES